MILKGLDVHDLDEENIAWLGILNLKGPGEVVNFGEVDVADVVGAVVVLDLPSCPGWCW